MKKSDTLAPEPQEIPRTVGTVGRSKLIDVHCHIGRIKSEELNELYDIPEHAGSEFLLSIFQKVKAVDKIFATPYATPHVGYENSLEWLLSEVKQSEKLSPVPVLHPQPEVTETFLERLDPSVIPGIKLHCGSIKFGYSLTEYTLLEPLFSFAEKNDLIVFIHTDTESCFARDLTPLLEEFQLRVVLLHSCRKEGVKFTRHSSVFLETSGCNPEDIDFVMEHTPQRVVFGSDFPFFDYESSLKHVKEYIPQIEENEKNLVT